jgi:signal transduction histidine kinase
VRTRSSPVLFFGFGSLLILVALAGLGAARRATQIFNSMSATAKSQRETTRIYEEIRSGVNLSGIYVRDYLLDPSDLTASMYRQRLLEIREEMAKEIGHLTTLAGPGQAGTLADLRRELDAYWDSLEPLFSWTPRQKIALSSLFLRRIVLPRREAALELAGRIRNITDANYEIQQRQLEKTQVDFRSYLTWMLGIAVSLGLLVAAGSIYRISLLEHASEQQRLRTELAEKELRRLSQELVHAQEAERRSISRELHDQVGQMLTALRMEIANLEGVRHSPGEQFAERVQEAKRLAEQTLASVRNLAMGLRPSILDDLGLGPALEWQGREFSRRSGLPVDVQIDGELDGLPESHLTCVFRIVQEALTNCARHAQAKSVRVALHGSPDAVSLSVRDDGVGFVRSESPGLGMGLIGIGERARELGGDVIIHSERGKGTTLHVRIPRPVKETA